MTLDGWLATACRLVRHGGQVLVVHRSDRLDEVLRAPALGASGIEVLPLWPRRGRPARRVLVRITVGRRRPFRLLAGLVLHGTEGHFTPKAESVLRMGAALAWEYE